MRWLMIVILLCTACEMPDAKESFAFITIIGEDGELKAGSGFMLETGYIATAHHVAKHKGTMFVKNFEGEETTATVAYVNSTSDIALIKPKEDVWTHALETGKVSSGGLRRGCIIGRASNDISSLDIMTLCGTMGLSDDHVRMIGSTAKSGMSGGPCIVDGYAVGVMSFSTRRKGKDEIGFGFATCDTFALSTDYIEVLQPGENE